MKKKDHKTSQTKLHNKDKYKYIYKLVLFLILIFVCTCIGTMFLKKSAITVTTKSVSYQEKGNVDYKVYLKGNNYFDKKYLNKNLQYIASMIDYINTSFDYTFSVNNKSDYQYSYSIIGTVTATTEEESSQIVYKKDYVLKDEKTLTKKNTNSYHIKENINIDYEKYNDIINNLKADYALRLDSHLTVKLVVKTTAKNKKFAKPIVCEGGPEITMPLSEQTINISMNTDNNDNTKNIEEDSTNESVNFIYLGLSFIFYIIDLILIIKYIKKFVTFKEKQSEYNKHLKKILREYDIIIANTNNLPEVDDKEIIEVPEFSELVDVSERIEKPILFKEITKNKESKFLLIDKDIVYIYNLKEEKK